MTIGPFVTPFGATPCKKKGGGHTVLYNFVYCLHLCKAICRLKLQFNVDSTPIQLLATPFKHWFAAQHATCFECCATIWRGYRTRVERSSCARQKPDVGRVLLALYRANGTLHTSHNNPNGLLMPPTSRGHRDNDTSPSPSPNIGNAQHGVHRLRYSDIA